MSLSNWPVASPCIGVCRLDAAARICVGCGRTGDEIGRWRAADEADRRAVLAAIPERLTVLDVRAERTISSAADTASVLEKAIAAGDTVVVGCHGAVAEFMPAPGEATKVRRSGHTLEATVRGGALRLLLPDDIAVLATDEGERDPLLLAAPAAGRSLPVATGLTRIDPHPCARGQAEVLFDLGLGHAAVRFMVRTGDPVLLTVLDGLSGAPLPAVLAEAGPALIEASPTRVVETPLSCVEVTTPIPPTGGRSPVAPHTHLLLGAIALGRLLPPGVGCPPGLLPVALLYRRAEASR